MIRRAHTKALRDYKRLGDYRVYRGDKTTILGLSHNERILIEYLYLRAEFKRLSWFRSRIRRIVNQRIGYLSNEMQGKGGDPWL